MQEQLYQRVIIYPYARFVPHDQSGCDFRVIPVRFFWPTMNGVRTVSVDDVLTCTRAPALRAGGHGYKYTCRVSWVYQNKTHTQQSVLFYDPRRLQWFVEVPGTSIPKGWAQRFEHIGKVTFPAPPQKAVLASPPEGQRMKIKLYPLVRFIARDKETGLDYRLVPVKYAWESSDGRNCVTVNGVTSLMRCSSLKERGQGGFRYSCTASWISDGQPFINSLYLWFDSETLTWETEIPICNMPEAGDKTISL